MSYGVPARIGPKGIEKIYELDVNHIRKELDKSAGIVKEDIKIASEILKEKYGIT
jgi:malate/lactate dehydrogenase